MGIKDPVLTLDAAKINIFERLISKDRQPWMQVIERKLKRLAIQWGVQKAMTASPTCKQAEELKSMCVV